MAHPRPRVWTVLAMVSLFLATWIATVPPALAAVPLVRTTIQASPNPVVEGTRVTFTGTVEPAAGTPRNVRLHMEWTPGPFLDGSCQPVAYCFVDRNPYWVFPTLTSKVKLTFVTQARSWRTARLYLDSGGVGCVGMCPPSVYLPPPTVTSTLSFSTSAQIVAGASLHLTVAATANAGPIGGNLHVNLPAGVGAPTNLPEGATYSGPPAHYIDNSMTLNRTGQYTFDVEVTAADGSTLAFTARFFPTPPADSVDAVLSFKIGPDTTPPNTTAPSHALVSNSALAAGGIPVKLSWTGADNSSGIERYEIAQSYDSGAWLTLSTSWTGSSMWRRVVAGHTYRFRVRAIDHAHNVGTWAYGRAFRVTGYSETSTAIRYAGSWSLASSTQFWGGKAKASSSIGATARLTFTGSSVAWVSLKSPTRGTAYVYVNGVRVATVDLYSNSTDVQRIVWARRWSTSATRTLVIRVVETLGRQRVDLDGLIVLS